MSNTKIENRTVSARLELRGTADAPKLGGRAAAYNVLSSDLGGFKERLVPGAFRKALARPDKVYCLFNHDPNQVLGATKNKTLRLREDGSGLYFECDLPDTSVAKDCYTLVRSGLIDACSFSFQCSDDTFANETDPETGDPIVVRSVRDLTLFDVSCVSFPAYPTGTSVSARSKPHYSIVTVPTRSVVLWTPEESAELAEQRTREASAKEYNSRVEEWRTSPGTLTPLEKFILEQKRKDGVE
jgi:uncharacterized protein